VRGVLRKRLSFLLKNEISLYVAHLPLDAHGEVGNNIQILRMLGGEFKGFFAEVDGSEIGVYGRIERTNLNTLAQRLETLLSTNSRLLDFGKRDIEVVSVISGGGDFAIESASEVSDCLITGEQRYPAYNLAKELEFNVMYLGHYATEVPGIKALMNVVSKRFPEIDCFFIDTRVPY
jgi:putative NIF3 family GTP cyclohydrolase 1 type 2